MCTMMAAQGLNPAAVPASTMFTFVEYAPWLGAVNQMVFDPEAAEGTDDEPWWEQEVDD